MFRTRDFLLLLVTIVFLLVAIGATSLISKKNEGGKTSSVNIDVNEQEYTAEVFSPETISREERLAAMRKKIAEGGGLALGAPEAEEIQIYSEEVAIDEDEVITVGQLQRCVNYQTYAGPWPSKGVVLDVVEGARLVFEEEAPFVASSVASSSTPMAVSLTRSVLLQLPIVPMVDADHHCLQSDVVGIAKDGSLIRNNEAGLYGVFGPDTIIGYALDGYPIRGKSELEGDECGGSLVNGQYAYYLSADRLEILHCFLATPTTF